jgi:hypothetical protein
MSDYKPELDREEAANNEPKTESKEEADGEQDKAGGIKGILIKAGFTVLGALFGVIGTGAFNYWVEGEKETGQEHIERQRFDADLVKLAIQAQKSDDRLDFLMFMVKTHLIQDKDIRDGVSVYVQEVQKTKRNVPQYQVDPAAGELNALKDEISQNSEDASSALAFAANIGKPVPTDPG